MSFVSKTRNCVSKTRSFALKLMNSAGVANAPEPDVEAGGSVALGLIGKLEAKGGDGESLEIIKALRAEVEGLVEGGTP